MTQQWAPCFTPLLAWVASPTVLQFEPVYCLQALIRPTCEAYSRPLVPWPTQTAQLAARVTAGVVSRKSFLLPGSQQGNKGPLMHFLVCCLHGQHSMHGVQYFVAPMGALSKLHPLQAREQHSLQLLTAAMDVHNSILILPAGSRQG